MKMLRQWNGDSLKPIVKILEEFGLAEKNLKLLKYECITPNSFIWVLSLNGRRFCLIAEDYVPSLEHIKKAMKIHCNLNEENDEYKLVKAKSLVSWSRSSPVIAADTYKPPINQTEFVQYAVPSGYDFVFLGKSLK